MITPATSRAMTLHRQGLVTAGGAVIVEAFMQAKAILTLPCFLFVRAEVQLSLDRMRLRVLGIVLAGGKGTRLYPLTKERAKPAVPFVGKYRIIDFVLSNFINSGIYSIYVLTQFKSQSLLQLSLIHISEPTRLLSIS